MCIEGEAPPPPYPPPPLEVSMGKVYKRKRRACKLCKPHKMGIEKKRSNKERAVVDYMDKLIRRAV